MVAEANFMPSRVKLKSNTPFPLSLWVMVPFRVSILVFIEKVPSIWIVMTVPLRPSLE